MREARVNTAGTLRRTWEVHCPRAEVDAWRKEPHRDFERALAETKLPEGPDYEAANRFLINARKLAAQQP